MPADPSPPHPGRRVDRRRAACRRRQASRRRWSLLLAVAAAGGFVAVIGTGPRAQVGWLAESRPGAVGGPTASGSAESPPGPLSAPTAPGTSRPSTPTARPSGPTTAAPRTAASVPTRGSGRLVPVPGRAAATGSGRRVRYRLEIEGGLPLDRAAVARTVQRILVDPRGWQPIERVAFERTDRGNYDIRVLVASPATTDALCLPLDTVGQLSCRNGDRVVLNALRWAVGIPGYRGRLDDYHAYMVNHEVGHALGHGHRYCPRPGAPAPVMMQQTKGLGACQPNPWPKVTGG